jgi:Calponin homology (CH) domain
LQILIFKTMIMIMIASQNQIIPNYEHEHVINDMAAFRRNQAASWLRRLVGVVASRDLPEEPSEEEFRLGLRNGIILCNALNKLQPGTIPKVFRFSVLFILLNCTALARHKQWIRWRQLEMHTITNP